MAALINSTIIISGMTIKVIADDGDKRITRNLTTHETVSFKKEVLDRAIKLGMAEVI